LKILLTQNTIYLPTHGGANKANRILLEGLAERGHVCRVVSPAAALRGALTHEQFRSEIAARGISFDSQSASVDVFHHQGVEVHAVAETSHLRPYLTQQIREFEPTWVLVSSEDSVQLLLEAAIETDASRVVYLAHTTLNLPFGPGGFLTSEAKTNLLRRAAGVITVSEYLRAYLREWGGLDSRLLRFPVYGQGPFPCRDPHAAGCVMMVNPSASKGLPIFVELAHRLPHVPFAAVPTWATTEAELEQLKSLPNVELLPASDRIDDIFARTRVLLAPSLWAEAFGQIVVEAMLRGIPVLASDAGGLPEAKLGVDYLLPVNQITSYEQRLDERMMPVAIVPEQDAGPWEHALREVWDDEELYRRLSVASWEAAKEYVGGLSIDPFERFLLELDADAKRPTPEVTRTPETGGGGGEVRAQLEQLSPARRALLAQRLREKARSDLKKKPLLKARGDEPPPLSYAQQRLWFLHQLDPESPAYNIPAAVRLRGQLDTPALTRAVSEILRRHEVLRATFQAHDGEPVQLIAPHAAPDTPLLDLSHLPEPSRLAEAERLASAEARRPFDLRCGPLLRTMLVRLGADDHVLVFNAHHIAIDGRSIVIFFHELATLYKAFKRGEPSPLRELPAQYADYAAWQRERLASGELERQLGYWRARLKGAPEGLELADSRPAAAGGPGGVCWFEADAVAGEALRSLARRQGATLFMALLSCWQTLLSLYSGSQDVVVGTDIANRGRVETEELIGFFINQLVLRTDLSGDPTFLELLERTRETTLGAYAHQDVPFERLVKELKPRREANRAPLFQVKFSLEASPGAPLDLDGLKVSPLGAESQAAKLGLSLGVCDHGASFPSWLEYDTALLDRRRVDEIIADYQTLMREAAGQPEARLSVLKARVRSAALERRRARGEELKQAGQQRLRLTRPKPIRAARTPAS
jgi:glycosyltransferase involved in cell wall biosynthesis